MHGTCHARIEKSGGIASVNGADGIEVLKSWDSREGTVPVLHLDETEVQCLLNGRRRQIPFHDGSQQFQAGHGLCCLSRHHTISTCVVIVPHWFSSQAPHAQALS